MSVAGIAGCFAFDGERTRREQRAPLDIFLNKIVGDEPFMCRARNISTGGIYLASLIEPSLEGRGG